MLQKLNIKASEMPRKKSREEEMKMLTSILFLGR
jgi:hypothetical protein